MSRFNVRCAIFGHRWGPNRAPDLKRSGGYCLCERCGEMGFVV